jgi:hypothetical protein
VIPPEQYLASYTFFTDPTYPETNLVLVRERKNGAFADVNVDCAGTVTGWQPIDSGDNLEYTRLDLVTGNFMSVGAATTACTSRPARSRSAWSCGPGAARHRPRSCRRR